MGRTPTIENCWKNRHGRALECSPTWHEERRAAPAMLRWYRRLGGRTIMKASAFEEACQFLSCYLEMEHPGYTTRDVLAGIERLQAVTGEGEDKRAGWFIERARCRLYGTPHKDNRW